MDIIQIFSEKLKKLRAERKLSQEEAAFRSGLSVYYVSKIEHAQANPSLKIIEKLAKELEVDIKEFF